MRRRILTAAAALCLTGCYHAVIETGAPPSDKTVSQPWTPSFVYGLVPPPVVNSASQCPNGVARVETQHSFLNVLAAMVTFSLYTPIHVSYTCASSGRSSDPRLGEASLTTSVTQTAEAPAPVRGLQRARTCTAQPAPRRFAEGDLTAAVTAGIARMYDANLGGAARIEKAVMALPAIACGVIAVEGFYELAYGSSSYSIDSYASNTDHRYDRPGVSLNYHLRVHAAANLDPFIGLGVGRYIHTATITSRLSGVGSQTSVYRDQSFFAQPRVGIRYFASPHFAYQAEGSLLLSTAAIGVVYRP